MSRGELVLDLTFVFVAFLIVMGSGGTGKKHVSPAEEVQPWRPVCTLTVHPTKGVISSGDCGK